MALGRTDRYEIENPEAFKITNKPPHRLGVGSFYIPFWELGFWAALKKANRKRFQAASEEYRLLYTNEKAWGVKIEDVEVCACDRTCNFLWYGTEDWRCPDIMGLKLATRMKGSVLKVFHGEGHNFMQKNDEQVLLDMVKAMMIQPPVLETERDLKNPRLKRSNSSPVLPSKRNM